jgi:conjugal transfer/entry exclusion protein
MAQKTEKLSQEVLDKLTSSQTKINELLINLGQIHLRTRDLNTEIKRLEEVKADIEKQSDEAGKEFNETLKELESKYPKGEINLKEGTVIFESAE